MTTIHAYTGDQMLLDGHTVVGTFVVRAGAANIVPNSTGAAKAIGLVIPELNGKLDSDREQRVPIPTGSVTELVAVCEKNVTVDEVNAAMKAATNESYGYTEDPDCIFRYRRYVLRFIV